MPKIKKAIIPVGGYGTRFLPATKAQPKEMLTVVDKPVIQYLVEEAVASGIEDIIFVTNRNKRAIEDHFDHFEELEAFLRSRGKGEMADKIHSIAYMARFTFVRQKEPKGAGDAILQATHLIGQDEAVAVLYGDDIVDSKVPALKQLIGVYEKYKAPVLSLERIPKKDVYKYGVVEVKKMEDRVFEVKSIVEKPKVEDAPSNIVSIGKHIVTKDVIDRLKEIVPVEGKELFVTDAFAAHLERGGKIYGCEFEGQKYDCGDKLGYLKAVVNYGLKNKDIGKDFALYLKGLQRPKKV